MFESTHAQHPVVLSHPLAREHNFGWLFKTLAWTSVVFSLLIILNVASYFVFQRVTMPFTNINGQNYSFVPYATVEADVNKRLASERVTVVYGEKSADFSYKDLGLTFDSDSTFEFADQRTIWNIPLVQLMLNGTAQIKPSFQIDHSRLESSMGGLVPTLNTPAKDAELIFPFSSGGDFVITESASGQSMNPQIAAEQFLLKIQTLDYSATNVELEPKNVAPAATKAELEDKVELAKEIIKEPLVVTDEKGKEVIAIQPETFIHLMGSEGAEIKPDAKLLKRYIHEELALYFYTETIARRVDGGVLTAAGKDGVGIDEEYAQQVLTEALSDPDVRTVSLKKKTIKAPVVTDGVYPKTDEGLATLLRDFDNSKYGEYNLVVRSMKDGGIGATQDATPIIIPASTYKAFIAYAALKSIENGEMTLDTVTPHGTVRDCMYEMIHVSTDHCAISIQDYMGWDKVDDMIHDAGFVDTQINNEGFGGEKYTTALDEYRLFRGLYDGSLLNKEHTNHLLDLFKNQMWRSGIPAGSAPAVVADKVGFYALRENDVGIVYAQQGDYIIVAMSYKGSFGEISQLARQVYQFFGN